MPEIEVIAAEPEASEGPSQDWLDASHTTLEQLENDKWAANRTQDIEASATIKRTLGQDYDTYRKDLEDLSADDRLYLVNKSAEEIATYLDERATAERSERQRKENAEKERQEQAEARLAATETPQLREVRNAMKRAYEQLGPLNERIAELEKLNELRNDPTAEGWKDLPTEDWAAAREGKLQSHDAQIQNLLQQKQALLQEATLHQNAYHEGARVLQMPPPQTPPAIVGHVSGNDGRPVQITEADIATQVQLRMDQQAHAERVTKAQQRYPDWAEVGERAIAAGLVIDPPRAAFIQSLPNSEDVTYYLATHHDETRALAQMPGHLATRALIEISHKVRGSASNSEPRKTKAPKPPDPVGGGHTRGFDVNDTSISNDDWMRLRNAQVARRR